MPAQITCRIGAELAPVFSTVNAYLPSAFPGGTPPGPNVAPPGGATVISSAVVASFDGTVTLTGLAYNTTYICADNTDGAGKWRYWRVTTEGAPAGSGLSTVLPLNVRDYGAVADGTTNDTAAIQAAINAAAGSAFSGGRSVYLPGGTYAIGSTLDLPANVRLYGDGNATILRATGDGYYILRAQNSNNGAYRATVERLAFDASAQQTSGGAFYSSASQGTITLSDLLFGDNLYSLVNVTPTTGTGGGRYFLSRLRVLSLTTGGGAAGITKGFIFNGSSTVQLVEVYGSHWDCTAAGGAPTDWLDLKRMDTFQLAQALFQNGATGLTTNNDGAGNKVTSCRFSSCVFDSQTSYGVSVDYALPIDFIDCQVVSCTSATNPAVTVGANSKGLSWIGGMIARNTFHGLRIKNGAVHTLIQGAKVLDNNQGNTANTYGIDVEANTTDFQILGCSFHNAFYGGHQKRGISIAAGTSTRYTIQGSATKADADLAVPVFDGGSGTEKSVATGREDLTVLKRRLWRPSGVIDESFPRWAAVASQDAGSMAGGTLYVSGGLVIPAGVTVSNISLIGAVTVATAGTHLWACLIDQARNVLAKTVDDTSAAPVTAHTLKTMALSAAYTPSVDTPVYVGICQTFSSGSASAFYGWAQSTGAQNLLGGQTGAPILAGTSTGGLTTPASLGATAAAFAATPTYHYSRLT